MEDRFLGFRRYLVQQKRAAPNTVASYLRDVAGLDRFAGFSADIDYAAASPDLVSSYLNQLKDQGRKPSTLNRVRASISCYYRYLTEQGIANGNPAKICPFATAQPEHTCHFDNSRDGPAIVCPKRSRHIILPGSSHVGTVVCHRAQSNGIDCVECGRSAFGNGVFVASAGRHQPMLPIVPDCGGQAAGICRTPPCVAARPRGACLVRQQQWRKPVDAPRFLEDHQAACPPSRHPKGYHAPKFAPFLGHSSAAEWSHAPRPSADLGIRRSNRSSAVRQTVSPELDGKLQSASSPGREKGSC